MGPPLSCAERLCRFDKARINVLDSADQGNGCDRDHVMEEADHDEELRHGRAVWIEIEQAGDVSLKPGWPEGDHHCINTNQNAQEQHDDQKTDP